MDTSIQARLDTVEVADEHFAQIDMVEVDDKCSGLNGYIGGGRQAFALKYTWWRQTTSIQA